MITVRNAAGMVIEALFFGFFSGVFIALPPVMFVALTKDKSKVGTRIGMGFAIVSLGVLAGGPGAGAILGTGEELHWNGAWIYAGLCALAGSATFAVVRVWIVGLKVVVRV